MSNGYFYRRRAPMTPEELAKLLKQRAGSPAWRLQEQIDDLEFKQVDASWLEGLPAGLWPQGRVFGPNAEIRWWMTDEGNFDVLILSETCLEFSDEGWNEQQMEVSDEYGLYLWGERKPGDPYWIETRIPRPLHYPVDEQEWQQHPLPYVKVVARDYAENGVVRLTRLVRLEPTGLSQGGNDG